MMTSSPFPASTPQDTARALFGLEGKTVLVTGASSGIGRATAQWCAAAGARLIISGRDIPRLEATRASLAGEGHRTLPADLKDADALQQLAAGCAAEILDGAVHCAGQQGQMPMKSVSDALLYDTLHVNFHAPVMLTRHLLARRGFKNGASILFLSSIAALTGTIGVAPYSASKAAL
ncbi:MAG: SDR family oxidoreductase, partial [Zoogloeaceae bacterium]|nr:SDR family oxidoreductase [Zoogloeaceae bacterium]